MSEEEPLPERKTLTKDGVEIVPGMKVYVLTQETVKSVDNGFVEVESRPGVRYHTHPSYNCFHSTEESAVAVMPKKETEDAVQPPVPGTT